MPKEDDKKAREEKGERGEKGRHKHWHRGGGGWGGTYFLAMIGVAVYNVQHVHGFWPIILALLKAIVWPAFLMHKVFTLLGM